MINLNLETTGKEQEIIKQYLEENASETLADKINNGVKIVKDNKTLINKKDLTMFMKYACKEARKQAEKGANSACIEDKVVFGWAIHYFEEDSIEGKLFNEDGTEYKPKTIVPSTPKQEPKIEIKKPNPQASFFDLLSNEKLQKDEKIEEKSQENTQKIENNADIEEEQEEIEEDEILSYKAQCAKYSQPDPLFDNEDDSIENDYKIDKKTGEVLGKIEQPKTTNKDYEILNNLLDNKLIDKE